MVFGIALQAERATSWCMKNISQVRPQTQGLLSAALYKVVAP